MGIPSTETSRNAKGSILKRLGRAAVALVAATATLASGLIVAGSASADTLPPGATDSWTYGYWYNRDAPRGHFLGVEYYENGNPVYCIESGVQVTGQGTWSNAADPDHRTAAWMVEKHKGEKDNLTQAAIAYAIHSHIESNNGATFRELVASGLQGADINAVAKRAGELWDEAYTSTPANAKMSYEYTNGKRTGKVNPGIVNRKGQYVSGIKYTARLTGPAVFDQTHTNTISGTTTGQETHIPWTATGNGTVKADVSYQNLRGAILNSPGQKLFRATDPENQTSDIQFQVQRDFQPTATTTVGNKELEVGNPVTDTVTSGTAQGDQWADNIPVTFKGYYFIGEAKDILKTVNRNANETPTDYLKRLRNTSGIRQVAAATTRFTRSGQTNTVTAKTATGPIGTDISTLPDYQVAEEDAGLFGTWVWVEMKAEQTQQDYIKGDFVHEFGKVQETSSHPGPPNHDSTVLEQESGKDKDILDEINISGLPEDYGTFKGNTTYGFTADADATIRVWWAGSGSGNRTEDEKYKPSTVEQPTADAHHKIVGEWKVPMRNGRYKVGGGKITFIDGKTGDSKVVATGVNIRATKKSEFGYYVFVFDFPGSSRAKAFTSDYNDAWERTFVTDNPHNPSMTTNVNATTVTQDEQFYDTATISGSVPRGSYVKFTAYDAVSGQPDTTVNKLLDNAKVNVTNTQADNSDTKQFEVKSPSVSTSKAGKVYWKATLYNSEGKILASHSLGLENETVEVVAPTITTQVTKQTVKPGEEFADKATIKGGVVKGSYVTFTAYDAVSGDPDTNAKKLLDNVRVNITDAQAEASGVNKQFTVTSPKTHTGNAGSVYWVATLWSPKGVKLASHELGLPSETSQVNPGGIVTSNAQKMGATGEQLYDEITVYDETSADDSADGKVHEGNGDSNPTGSIGAIPQGSTVTVEMYRQSSDDNGDNGLFKIGEKTVKLDTNKFTAIKEGQNGNRPGKLTVKVTDPSFKTDKAGMIYWKTTLKTPQGGVLDQHIYGEYGSDHKTGYKSYERTPVQKFSTTVSKKWLSAGDSSYEDKTNQVYDVLHQTAYEPYEGTSENGDTYRTGNTAQTPNGAKVQFEIWAKDGSNAGKMVKQYNAEDLPKIRTLAKSEDPDKNHPYVGDDSLDNYQNVKSSTFTVPSDWSASKYYYRVKVTVPATTPGNGTDSADKTRDVVWYGGYDESEAFDLIHVDTTSTEPLWLDSMNVSDEITLKGNIPAGSQYEAELWRTSKDGKVRKDAASKQDDSDHNGIASEKVATTGRVDVPSKATGAHLDGVTFRSKSVKNPGVGSYIWRVKLYTPEMPHKDGNGVGTGGDTSMNASFGVITKEWMEAAKATTDSKDSQSGDYWQNATAKRKGNGDGYSDRWLLFDGKNVATEKFDVVKLTTSVDGTPNIHTSDGEHYVDVTNGTDVNDKLTIDGYMLKDYKVAFKLWKKAVGQGEDKDTVVKTVDPVALTEAQKTLDSASTHLAEPGDYYWQWVFTKPDGTAFQPDNTNPAVSGKRIKEESFHAVRVTTSTYKWGSKDGTVSDVARIEGTLPGDAGIVFELHDYADGKKIAETKSATLKELGYDASKTDQQITGPALKVPSAADYYWVEVVTLKGDKTVFHTGKDKVANESLRAIDAQTDIATERYVGTVVKDHADLTNVKWKQSGDIRDDLKDGLRARWFLFKQGDGDVKTDKKVFTSDYVKLESGQTEVYGPEHAMKQVGDYYWQIEISDPSEKDKVVKLGEKRDPRESFRILEATSEAQVAQQVNKPTKDKVTITGHPAEGTLVSWNLYKTDADDDADENANGDKLAASYQTPAEGAHLITADEAAKALKDGKVTVESPEYIPAEVGEYYWVFSLTSPTKNLAGDGESNLPKDDKDTSHLESDTFFTDRAHVADETVQVIDATTQTKPLGHVGEKFHDTVTIRGRVPEGSQADATLYLQGEGTPSEDKEVLTTKRVTLSEGQTTADLEDVTVDKPGVYYWREHIYVPTKHTTAADHGKQVEVEKTPTITGEARVSNETVSVVSVTTTTHRLAESGTELQDTAKIDGETVDGSYIIFTLWKQDKGNDASKDVKVFTSGKVMLKAGQKEAESPAYKVSETGTYYWRESIYNPAEDEVPPCVPPTTGDTSKDTPCDSPVHTEKPRTPGESTDVVKVTTKAQANGTATKPVKDTALIEGTIPNDDYELVFELWKQGNGDVASDKKVATTDAVNVPRNATKVDSPNVTPSEAGTYYWREKLVEKSTKRIVHYGDARVPGETVTVGELAKTGIATGFILPLAGVLAFVGLGLGIMSDLNRRRRTLAPNGSHMSGSKR